MSASWVTVLRVTASLFLIGPQSQQRTADQASPGLDHIPIAVGNLESAAERYRALGFVLKPGRPHDNGIRNQHAKFLDGTELELITAPEARDDLTATYRRHLAAGEGPAFLAFYVPGLSEAGRNAAPPYVFFGGLNRSPTDKPEHFTHPNGAEALIGVWLADDDLSRERTLLQTIGARIEHRAARVPDPLTTEVARMGEDEVGTTPWPFPDSARASDRRRDRRRQERRRRAPAARADSGCAVASRVQERFSAAGGDEWAVAGVAAGSVRWPSA